MTNDEVNIAKMLTCGASMEQIERWYRVGLFGVFTAVCDYEDPLNTELEILLASWNASNYSPGYEPIAKEIWKYLQTREYDQEGHFMVWIDGERHLVFYNEDVVTYSHRSMEEICIKKTRCERQALENARV